MAAPAPRAKPRARHWGLLLSFLLVVVAPTGVVAWYLWERAADRYESVLGFSVRTEDVSSPMEFLGGLGLGGSASGSDTDILYRFVQSQEIVAAVDQRLDLRALWSKADPARDPVYAFHTPGTIEDLTDYWNRMVQVYNDRGLLDVEVQAFAPEDAQAIAQAIWEESQDLINRLSTIALQDATGDAEEELGLSVERLKAAREAVTRFRNVNQMVDPTSFIASQTGLLASLESQLAQTLIELDLLREGGAGDADPRVEQTLARVDVIQSRMAEERAKLGQADDTSGTTSADIVGEYERLMVDQEFAQQAYVAAMAAYDAALAEGRRQSRYLAAHVQPTLAERADRPARVTLTLLTALFAALIWIVLSLTAYALRDRR